MESTEKLLSTALQSRNFEEARRIINEINLYSFPNWERGFNILCYTLQRKQLEIATLLVNRGCKLRLNSFNTTALHVAILNGDINIIELIHNKIDREDEICSLLEEDEDGKNAFHIFAYRKVDQECHLILDFLLRDCRITVKSSISRFSPIHYAVKYGNTEMVQLLLSKDNTQVNIVSESFNYTLLHLAVESGHQEMVLLLLRNFAKVAVKTTNNESALCLAVKLGLKPIVEILLLYYIQKPIFEPCSFDDEQMLIYCAVESNDISMVNFFLNRGLHPNNFVDKSGKTPLHLAVEKGSLNIVKLLLQHGANIQEVKARPRLELPADEIPSGFSVLHFAAKYSHLEIFVFLLEMGAIIDIVDAEEKNALHVATKQGSLPIVNTILNNVRMISPLFSSDSNGQTPLHIAVSNGNIELVELFLNWGICVNSKTKTGLASIHIASEKGHLSMVEFLLKYGANVNLETHSGETPLSVAIKLESVKMVSYLLESGANINNENSDLLFTAISLNNFPIVELLLRFGHSFNYVGIFQKQRGFTVLHLAIKKNNIDMVNALLEKGFFIETHTEKDFPLHYAIDKRNDEMITEIIKRGASLDTICEKGLNPLLHALLDGNIKMFKLLLLRKGASFSDRTLLGKNLLHFAFDNLLKENVIRFLVEFGTNVNERNEIHLSLIERIMYEKTENVQFDDDKFTHQYFNHMSRSHQIIPTEHNSFNETVNEDESDKEVWDNFTNGSLIMKRFYDIRTEFSVYF